VLISITTFGETITIQQFGKECNLYFAHAEVPNLLHADAFYAARA
jgi:hypothetical protein